MDFQDIKGQEHCKRGLEVAVAGKHNVLLIGTEKSSMNRLIKAVPSIEDGVSSIEVCNMKCCPCGNFTHYKKECTCTPLQIQRYLATATAQFPITLDSIDIHLEVPALNLALISDTRRGEASSQIKERVLRARASIVLTLPLYKVTTDREADELLKLAILELGISAKSYDKIVNVARTIAVLDGKQVIEAHHISEAISYRSLDRNLWG